MKVGIHHYRVGDEIYKKMNKNNKINIFEV